MKTTLETAGFIMCVSVFSFELDLKESGLYAKNFRGFDYSGK